jgi:hypothetical protein
MYVKNMYVVCTCTTHVGRGGTRATRINCF